MSANWSNPSQTVIDQYESKVKTLNPALSNNRWTVHDAEEALLPQPPIDYLVQNLITRGSVNLFYGEPGSKKTYSLIHLGISVAMGIKWLGMETKPSKVLVIDEESGNVRFSRRLGEIMRGEVVNKEVPLQYVCLAGFKLDNTKDSVLLENLILETGADLVIIDALAEIMDGDENSKQDTQPVFTTLRRIAVSTNAAIIVIHHSNKAGGYRGSSAIKGAVDLMVQVTSEDGDTRIEFKTEKTRDCEAIKFAALATWENSQFYLTSAEPQSKTPIYGKAQNYVLRYLTEHGPSTVQDIMSSADTCAPNGARAAVYSLVTTGKLKRTNPNASLMSAAIYDLAERVNHE